MTPVDEHTSVILVAIVVGAVAPGALARVCVIEPGNRFLASCPRLGAVNSDGTRALGEFFSAVLTWPLVWDENEETAIQAPDGSGPKITWSGPPLLPKSTREPLHLHLPPASGTPVEEALEHLLAHGATPRAAGPSGPDVVALADVDGNVVCLADSPTRGRP